jgi:hypothetical protein
MDRNEYVFTVGERLQELALIVALILASPFVVVGAALLLRWALGG